MIDKFHELSDSVTQQKPAELWNTDTASQEARWRSIYIWNKKERLLKEQREAKKHEDSQKSSNDPWIKAKTPRKSGYNMCIA